MPARTRNATLDYSTQTEKNEFASGKCPSTNYKKNYEDYRSSTFLHDATYLEDYQCKKTGTVLYFMVLALQKADLL